MNNTERFKKITNEMLELYKIKNKNYNNSFSKSFEEFGMIMPLIRISDKLNRMKSIVKQSDNANVGDESLRDSIIDCACYCVLTLMELEKYDRK